MSRASALSLGKASPYWGQRAEGLLIPFSGSGLETTGASLFIEYYSTNNLVSKSEVLKK